MARVDDYINAKTLAMETLSKETAPHLSRRSGFELKEKNILRVPFLDQVYLVTFPSITFVREGEGDARDIPVQEQVLILHYLQGQGEFHVPGPWVSYREIPGASFYYSAFVKRAVDPLKNTFGRDVPGFKRAAERLNGMKMDTGDSAFVFQVFPRVSLQLIVWEGDDEFPPEANILFHGGVESILSPEDIAWLAGMLVYRLMFLARQ